MKYHAPVSGALGMLPLRSATVDVVLTAHDVVLTACRLGRAGSVALSLTPPQRAQPEPPRAFGEFHAGGFQLAIHVHVTVLRDGPM